MVLCGVLLGGPLSARAQNEISPVAVSETQASHKTIAPCPLTTPTYTATLAATELEAVAGRKVRVHVVLDPETPPMGFYVTTLVDVLTKPEDAELTVLPGFPDIALTPSAPGEYQVEVRVNLIAKSSCGGVKATQLGREILTLNVDAAAY